MEPQLGKESFLFPKSPVVMWDPPSLQCNDYQNSSPGVKRPQREADHSPSYTAEVKSEWSCNSTPPTRLKDAERDKFTFSVSSNLIVTVVKEMEPIPNSFLFPLH